jgi:hypothetical protein
MIGHDNATDSVASASSLYFHLKTVGISLSPATLTTTMASGRDYPPGEVQF